MAKSKSHSLPEWRSLDELVDYFDTHDMGEHLERMPEVDLEVDITRRRHLVAIDDDILVEVAKAAKTQSVSSEELINAWLRDKLLKVRR